MLACKNVGQPFQNEESLHPLFVIPGSHGHQEIPSAGALHLTSGSAYHSSRTKHTAVRFHFLRDLVADKVISVHHMPTQHQLADLFTKHLDKPTFSRLREEILSFKRKAE